MSLAASALFFALFTRVRGIGILGSCPVGSCIALRPGYPSGCPGLAFIMRVLLAALFCLAPVRQRGLSLCAPSALRGTVGGATMTTLGGAGTLWTNLYLPRARLIGFYHRVGAPTGPPLGAPTLRFALVSYPTSSVAALCLPPLLTPLLGSPLDLRY